MPTTLSNGVRIFNATPHDLIFWCGQGGVKVAPPDQLINAQPVSRTVEYGDGYVLVEMYYEPTEAGRKTIRSVKERDPKTLIVGSAIAAQAYAGDVVAPITVNASRKHPARTLQDRYQRLVWPNRFTTFKKENA